jgi:hypothetical protein
VSYCDICFRHYRGFTYKCDTCWEGETFDIQCGSIPETLKHEGHQHTLFLALDSSYYRECKACPSDNEVCIRMHKLRFHLGNQMCKSSTGSKA